MSKKNKKHPSEAPPRRPRRMAVILGAVSALLVVLLVGFVALAAYGYTRPLGGLLSGVARPQSPFNGKRAFEDLKKIVALGPRVSGSRELQATRDHVKTELQKVGIEVREFPFVAKTPLGDRNMVNVVGVVQGSRPDIIILGNHYETKYFPDFRFVGANDGGSSTAWMIEMGRALGPKREGCSIWLCFFDGEEALKEWTETDSLYGSREFVRNLKATGDIARVRAMINVDMIGDCFLGISRDPDAPAWLIEPVWRQAKDLGYTQQFLKIPRRTEDDHIPFRRAGIPALELIDFAYGKSFIEHNQIWHTPNDTLDKVCSASLQAVGDVIYHALPEIEARLPAASPGV